MPQFHEIWYFYIELSDLPLLASRAKHSGHGGKVWTFPTPFLILKKSYNYYKFFYLTFKLKINEGGCLKQKKN